MIGVVLLFLAGTAQAAELCYVTEKCGASGMCVAARDLLRIERTGDVTRVEGVPAPQSADTFKLATDGRFHWRPAHEDTHAEGVRIDQMAVSFAGTCEMGPT